MKWTYEECDCVQNKLQYLTPGCGLIEILFDKDSKPSVRGLDGAPYFTEIPDKEELLEEIRKKYPNGFHSRTDVNFEWLAERIQKLAKTGGVQINSLEEYGCMMVDGINYDAYKLEVEHSHIKSPIYIASLSCRQEFVVFRPYIQVEEFGAPENIGCFQHESEPSHIDAGEAIYFQDEIVSYKSYKYEYDSDKRKEESYGFKNNISGFRYDTKFGRFMSGGGVTHL